MCCSQYAGDDQKVFVNGPDLIIRDWEETNRRERAYGEKGKMEEMDADAFLNKTVFFSEDKFYAEEKNGIWKYEEVPVIAEKLRMKYREVTGVECLIFSNEKGTVIGFSSGSGGSGASCVALGTARELAEEGYKKVLYLSFEPFPCVSVYMGEMNSVQPIGDYLYYLFSGRADAVLDPGSFLFHDEWGVESFRYPIGVNELSLLTIEQCRKFLRSILDFRRYDYICVDIPGNGSDRNRKLAEDCYHLFLVRRPGLVGKKKQEQLLEAWGYSESDGKGWISRVCNFWNGEEEQAEYRIGKEADAFREKNGKIELHVDRTFGRGVKELAEEIRRLA